MSVNYYFISDLHIGGDEALGVCDYEEELIEFLRNLAEQQEDVELLIVGDIFGMWEFTNITGPQKMNALMQQFPKIFAAFREAGEKVKITMLPGNHDYEIACYPEFVDLLKAYNTRYRLDLTGLIFNPVINYVKGKRSWRPLS